MAITIEVQLISLTKLVSFQRDNHAEDWKMAAELILYYYPTSYYSHRVILWVYDNSSFFLRI